MMFWWACVGSWPHVWLINWVTQTEGENAAKGADKDREKKGEGALPLMHAYSLPVWLWRTVTLFAWLVEPLGHDWPCYIILSLSFFSSCHLLFIRITLQNWSLSSFSFNTESDQFIWQHIQLHFPSSANLFCALLINMLQQRDSCNIRNALSQSVADFYKPNFKINDQLTMTFFYTEGRTLYWWFCCCEQHNSFSMYV